MSDILPENVREEKEIQACVEKWLDRRWVQKEMELQHFIDHGEFRESSTENRIEMKPSFLQFIRDVRFWMVPIIILYSIGAMISGIVKGLVGYLLQISVHFVD